MFRKRKKRKKVVRVGLQNNEQHYMSNWTSGQRLYNRYSEWLFIENALQIRKFEMYKEITRWQQRLVIGKWRRLRIIYYYIMNENHELTCVFIDILCCVTYS